MDPFYDPDIDALMEFRLTYAGKLMGASRNNTRAQHKHEIRKVFHRQLKRLWAVAPQLSVESVGSNYSFWIDDAEKEPKPHTVENLSVRFARCGYGFVPLATRDLTLSCGLEILFLRPDPPGSVLSSGDIDNRLKTLFDALRLPRDASELGGYVTPAEDETPFFCLLEDDSLVTKVSVETDILLESTGTAYDANDARIVITVRLRPYELHVGNMKFG